MDALGHRAEQVALREDADQAAVFEHHRRADICIGHQLRGLPDRVLGRDRENLARHEIAERHRRTSIAALATMERVRFFILACCLVLLVTGCGGDSDETGPAAKIGVAETTSSTSGSLPRWVDSELAATPGGFVSLTLSSSDFAVGPNRLGFLIVRQNGKLVQSPRATVWVGTEEASKPARAEAELVPLEPHSHPPGSAPHDHLDATDLYVTQVDLPANGRYWVVV